MLFKQVDNLIYEHVQDYMYKYGIVKLTKESASDKTNSVDAMEALKKFLGVKTALLLGDNKEDKQK